MQIRSGKVSNSELWIFGLVAVGLLTLMYGSQSPYSNSAIPDGTPLPEIMAAGWLNTDSALTRGSLQGKVVVMDCWATWCPPCRAAMPELAKLYKKYEPLGVEFLGLTPESANQKSGIEGFIQTVDGFDWPVAYGTNLTIDMLGIQYFPTVIVFDTSGQAVWSSTRLRGIESVLDQALAQKLK